MSALVRMVMLAAVVSAALASSAASSSSNLNPQILVLEPWSLPPAYVSAFTETENKRIPGVIGWEATYRASASSGDIIVHSTAQVFASPGSAHRRMLTVAIAGSRRVSVRTGLPTQDSQWFDRRENGRDKWTIVWRSTRVIASLSFDAADLGTLDNFQEALVLAKAQEKWMKAGGA